MEEIRQAADRTLGELKRGSRTERLVKEFRDACVAFFREVPPPITGPFEEMSPPYRAAAYRPAAFTKAVWSERRAPQGRTVGRPAPASEAPSGRATRAAIARMLRKYP
jgi:hypothetical protein